MSNGVRIKMIGRRDLRVSRRGMSCVTHRFTGIGRTPVHGKAASALRQRYGRTSASYTPLERVFQRAGHPSTFLNAVTLHIAPHYHVLMRRFHHMAQRSHTRERVVERRMLPSLLAERRKQTHHVQTVMTCLTQQFQRVEDGVWHKNVRSSVRMGEPVEQGGRSERTIHLWSHRVEMVLRRSGSQGERVPQAKVPSQLSDGGRRVAENDRMRSGSPRALSLAEFSTNDLQRLTDQVVTQLDHRVIAARERLGRL